jgi:hypothetical protein
MEQVTIKASIGGIVCLLSLIFFGPIQGMDIEDHPTLSQGSIEAQLKNVYVSSPEPLQRKLAGEHLRDRKINTVPLDKERVYKALKCRKRKLQEANGGGLEASNNNEQKALQVARKLIAKSKEVIKATLPTKQEETDMQNENDHFVLNQPGVHATVCRFETLTEDRLFVDFGQDFEELVREKDQQVCLATSNQTLKLSPCDL